MLNKNSLIAMLKCGYLSLAQKRTIDGTQEVVGWIPVLDYVADSRQLCHSYGLVVEHGFWAAEYADALRVSHANKFVAFYVLLESPFREVVALLKASLQKCGLPATVIQSFPFDQLLESALAHKGYWGQLANAWLDDGYPPNDKIAELAISNRAVRAWRRKRQEMIFGKFVDA